MSYLKSFFSSGWLHVYSTLLFLSTFLWMALPYNSGPDKTIQKRVGAVRMLLPDKTKPTPNEIIFIDVSKSKYLLPLNEDATENDIITNRKYLAELFTFITENDNQIKYLFCDVHFDSPTPDDSALFQSINGLQDKFLGIDVYKDKLYKSKLGTRAATASLLLQQGTVYKIPYFGSFGDTLIPFKIYSDLDKVNVHKNFLFTWFSGKGIAFNHQINDYSLRGYDFTYGNYIKVGLGELVSILKLSPEIFNTYLQNRYILIGDFERDVHSTYLTKQPGTLILFNAYLHLHHNRQILSVGYVVLLYIFLHWLAWIQTGNRSRQHKFLLKIKYFEPFEFQANILSISFLLLIFTYLSSLLFHVNVSIFHLITIFSVIDFIIFLWKKRIRC